MMKVMMFLAVLAALWFLCPSAFLGMAMAGTALGTLCLAFLGNHGLIVGGLALFGVYCLCK